MKRFLITSLLTLAVVLGVGAIAPTAYAAPCPINSNGTCPSGCVVDDQSSTNCSYTSTTAASTNTSSTTAAAINAAAAGTPTNPNLEKNGFASIMIWLMTLFAWLVGVAAITLDNAVYYTVVTMGNYIHNLSAVGVTWRILRDIGNIALIFGFLGIGISVILNTQWYGGKTKMLPMLLIAAVFLNFSLFLTQALIDVGNLFATQFYTQINGGKIAGAKSFTAASVAGDGISNKILGQLGLQTLYNNGQVNPAVLEATNSWLIGFMGIILFIITAFVLFSLAFTLIARFVMLLFLIIISPVGFAGFAVPQLKSLSHWWFDTLLKQTITAPVLLLLLYVALAVITDANFLSFGSSSATGWTGFIPDATGKTNLAGFASVLLSFLVAMGLLLYVTIAAKQLGAFGAAGANKLAGKLTFGATAWGMRKSVGNLSGRFSRGLRRTSLGRTTFGRMAVQTLDKGGKASFDLRGAKTLGGLSALGIDAGKAQEGGYTKTRTDNIHAYEAYAKSIEEAYNDRGDTKGQKAVAAAEKEKAAADKVYKAQQSIQTTTKRQLDPQIAKQRAELEKIEEEKKNDKYWDTDKANEKRLQDAKDSLAANEKTLVDIDHSLADAAAALKKAGEKVDETKAQAPKTFAQEKKDAQNEYADHIDNSFKSVFGLIHGSGYSQAAAHIRHSKSTKDKVFELLKQETEAGAKKPEDDGHGKESAGGHGAAPAPKAAATPVAPAGGGGGHGPAPHH